MDRTTRYRKFVSYFSETMLVAETELNYSTPFELLVAVILSAQCTDKRVNVITPNLLKSFPTAQSMSEASQEAIFELVKSCSYPNNKAKHLLGMSQMLVSEFNSNVPSIMNDLQKLPGVGRKTANVVLSVIYNQPAMAVDTHVFRVSARIGLTVNAKNPLECEQQLVKFMPKYIIPKAHHWLILHGRYVCKARTPDCQNCGLNNFCKYYKKTLK